MSIEDITALIQIAGQLTVTAVVMIWLWSERHERKQLQQEFKGFRDEMDKWREKLLERALDETDKLTDIHFQQAKRPAI